jgi:hypothetical protein
MRTHGMAQLMEETTFVNAFHPRLTLWHSDTSGDPTDGRASDRRACYRSTLLQRGSAVGEEWQTELTIATLRATCGTAAQRHRRAAARSRRARGALKFPDRSSPTESISGEIDTHDSAVILASRAADAPLHRCRMRLENGISRFRTNHCNTGGCFGRRTASAPHSLP